MEAEQLGPYDVFTLQLPARHGGPRPGRARGYRYQERPPYYVLQSDRLQYEELRTLRGALKRGAGLDPDEIEGCPPPDPAHPALLAALAHQPDALPRARVGRQLS